MENEQIPEYLYKYMSLEKFERFVDAILNNRLYAGKFNEMNDPMEGLFYYTNEINDKTVKRIIEGKNRLRFCCFSTYHNNSLMWSHYANGHKGVVLEVKADNHFKKVDYESKEKIIKDFNQQNVKKILSRKLEGWDYEQEYRVFKENNLNSSEKTFIHIKINKVFLGCDIKKEDEELIENLLKSLNPKITYEKMDKKDLKFYTKV